MLELSCVFQRSQAAILKHFKLPENVNPKKVPEETKFKIKGIFNFLGQFWRSVIMCTHNKCIQNI